MHRPLLARFDRDLDCLEGEMAIISKEAPVATVINVFTVAPAKQKQLATMLEDATRDTVGRLPGFVSASIHCSTDGTRVANYAQWQSREAFEAMLENPEFRTHVKPITEIAKADAHVYEVVATASARASDRAAETGAAATPDSSTRPHELVAERTMAVSPDTLYRAWTEQIDRWFAIPGSAIMEPAVNAVFFFETDFQGRRHPHYGRFLRREPDKLVQLTWVTEATKGAETVVTVELEADGPRTRLRLTHTGFPDEESMRQHDEAWPAVLEQLEQRTRS
jgi:uncharacterized protein YndB with AHSA1/START domain/heme-degrading monooxygenase HmoA